MTATAAVAVATDRRDDRIVETLCKSLRGLRSQTSYVFLLER